MAPDERDRSFDKALARHLRSSASAGAREAPASPSGACPDSETLAAYHERSLLPQQLNSLKEHIVGCERCQAILAQLEATDEISLQAFQQEEVAAKEAVPSPKRSRRILLLRGARWQWLAPAGALAAGLLVWIALHENQPLSAPDLKQVQVATSQAPPQPAPSVSSTVRPAPPQAKTVLTKPQSAADEFAVDGANARSAPEAKKSREKADYLAQVSPSRPLADKEGRKDAKRGDSNDSLRAQEQLDRDAKTVTGAGQENAEAQLQTQDANVQLQNQSNANAPKIPGPAPPGQMEAKKMKPTSAAPVPPPPPPAGVAGGVVSGYNASTALEVTNAISNPRLISPPGSRFLWRAGRGGLIELSKDGGSSWSRQTSGVLADLLTGSAPSDQVCWIVGRVGAILLTTDGGAHWKVVPSPLSEDLGGVRASDALQATIWNVRATKSFQTTDGGLTWTPVPSP
jgi:hypothetical protein